MMKTSHAILYSLLAFIFLTGSESSQQGLTNLITLFPRSTFTYFHYDPSASRSKHSIINNGNGSWKGPKYFSHEETRDQIYFKVVQPIAQTSTKSLIMPQMIINVKQSPLPGISASHSRFGTEHVHLVDEIRGICTVCISGNPMMASPASIWILRESGPFSPEEQLGEYLGLLPIPGVMFIKIGMDLNKFYLLCHTCGGVGRPNAYVWLPPKTTSIRSFTQLHEFWRQIHSDFQGVGVGAQFYVNPHSLYFGNDPSDICRLFDKSVKVTWRECKLLVMSRKYNFTISSVSTRKANIYPNLYPELETVEMAKELGSGWAPYGK